jgi:hypothetical protein
MRFPSADGGSDGTDRPPNAAAANILEREAARSSPPPPDYVPVRRWTVNALRTTHLSDPLAAAVALAVVPFHADNAMDQVARAKATGYGPGCWSCKYGTRRSGACAAAALLQGVELVTDRTTKTPGRRVQPGRHRGLPPTHLNVVQHGACG